MSAREHAARSFRTFSRSLVEMAAVTGLVLRLGRSLMLSPEGTTNLFAVGALYLFGGAFLLGMATLHLSNYTLRRWLWRAPLFVLAEVAAELLASLVLITLGREPWGTGAADFHDWPTIAGAALLFRSLLVLPFVAVLGGVVQATRAWAARRSGRALKARPGVEIGSRK